MNCRTLSQGEKPLGRMPGTRPPPRQTLLGLALQGNSVDPLPMKWLAGFCQKNPLIRQAVLLACGMIQIIPFRYIKTSPGIIRLAVMLYIRFPLSLRNVECLLHERVSTSALRQYGSGGAASGRCLLQASAEDASGT